ncbi:glycoside hydrolase family 95 protein [Pseudalgibacter alginicilyticus]|nr:glycoside hydrolase family 95 protein [Pseudalgibacter alginicilyticus]
MYTRQVITISLILFGCIQIKSQSEHSMWFRNPANDWHEALPVGNGYMGAMIFGGTRVERIQLNEETIWSGTPKPRIIAPDYVERKMKGRELIFDGKYKEAEELLYALKKEKYTGKDGVLIENVTTTEHGFETAGDIYLYFDSENEIEENYRRELDLKTAVVNSQFSRAGSNYSREVIASYPDKILAMRLQAKGNSKLSFEIKMKRPVMTGELIGNFVSPPKALINVYPAITEVRGDNYLVMKGQASDNGNKFEVHLKVVTDGICKSSSNSLKISKSSETIIYVHIVTDFYTKDLSNYAEKIVDEAIIKGYEQVHANHINDYKKYYDRVDFDLGNGNTNTKYPLDVRLRNIRNRIEDPRSYKGQLTDPGLISLFFNYNRYLFISSSREGTMPPALNYWNGSLYPAWYGRPTTNINQQMNFWSAEVIDLPELHLPMLQMLERFLPAGKEVAKKVYQSNGAVFPGRGLAFNYNPEFIYDTWNDAGGWFGAHFYSHYEFSNDKEYLEKHAYPYLKEMALFYLDNLIKHPTFGYLVTGPSYSPETAFILDGEHYEFANGITLSKAIIYETLKFTLEAAEILSVDKQLQKKIRKTISKLAPYKISEIYNKLQEWDKDYEEFIPGHRHNSHLYPIYPGRDITEAKPELFKAAENSLHHRLDNGGGWTGWSRAWVIGLAARFKDGNLAGEQIELLMRGQVFPNFFGAHKRGGHDVYDLGPNLAFPGVVAEMLIQSHHGYIEVLPALPATWKTGAIKGLRARGGYKVDLIWEDGKLIKVYIKSENEGICKLKYKNKLVSFETKANSEYNVTNELQISKRIAE